MERPPIHLGGMQLKRSCHACAFFHNREEEYRLLVPFLREGFEHGDKTLQIADVRHREERLRHLEEAGIPIQEALSKGQIEIKTWEEAYLRNDGFDQYAMLGLIEDALSSRKAQGYDLIRLWANMEWALKQLPGVEDLVEYETRLNYLLPQYDDVVVCTYDLSRFSAQVVMDVLRTHPMVIVGGILQENPFYVQPDAFLAELRGRNQRTLAVEA